MTPARWRWAYFSTREVRLARTWAQAGGIAVHENLFGSRRRRAAHLLAPDEARLVAAARYLGCDPAWIQRTRTVHFDLVGPYLQRALALCGLDPVESPLGRSGPRGSVCASPGVARPLGGCRDSPMQLLLLESQRPRWGGGGALISAALHAALLGSIVRSYQAEPPHPGLREQFVAYLAPPDRLRSQPGLSPTLAWAPEPGEIAAGGAVGPAQPQPSSPAPAPSLDPATAGDAGAGDAEESVFTELQVDSTVRRYPESAAPEYPADLLAKNIEGRALVSYVVDSSGLADTTTFRVLEASHPEFAAAVQRALARMRFRPALLGGRAVPQLVQQPFAFKIRLPDSTKPPPPPRKP